MAMAEWNAPVADATSPWRARMSPSRKALSASLRHWSLMSVNFAADRTDVRGPASSKL
jgi:hypothetical protein